MVDYNAVMLTTHKTRRPRELKEVIVTHRLPLSTVRQIDADAKIEGSSRSLIIRRLILAKYPSL